MLPHLLVALFLPVTNLIVLKLNPAYNSNPNEGSLFSSLGRLNTGSPFALGLQHFFLDCRRQDWFLHSLCGLGTFCIYKYRLLAQHFSSDLPQSSLPSLLRIFLQKKRLPIVLQYQPFIAPTFHSINKKSNRVN